MLCAYGNVYISAVCVNVNILADRLSA